MTLEHFYSTLLEDLSGYVFGSTPSPMGVVNHRSGVCRPTHCSAPPVSRSSGRRRSPSNTQMSAYMIFISNFISIWRGNGCGMISKQ